MASQHRLPGIASQFATKNPVLQCLVVFVLQKMCEACMLHSRVIVQALRRIIEIATQEMYRKLHRVRSTQPHIRSTCMTG